MSQITRCPACSTAFRVVADQLRISQGWVRCGQCQQVFDACAHLLTLEPPPPGGEAQQAPMQAQQQTAQAPLAQRPAGRANAPRAVHGALPAVPPVPPSVPCVPAPAVPAFLFAGATPGLEIEAPFALPGAGARDGPPGITPALAAAPVWPALAASTGQAPPLALQLPAQDSADVQAAQHTNGQAHLSHPTAHTATGQTGQIRLPAASDWSDGDSTATTILQTRPLSPLRMRRAAQWAALSGPQQQPGFVLAAQRKAFWRRPLVRAALAVLLALALLLLALQVLVQERDRIAALDARTRPWLALLCQPLGCQIAPQRQIADLVIDSSSFNKARGDSYLLGLTIKSRAAIALAMPAIELTLTDLQDQPVLRRVLLPADMSAPQELPAQGEWSGSLTVLVTTGGARVAGYRLLAFYP